MYRRGAPAAVGGGAEFPGRAQGGAAARSERSSTRRAERASTRGTAGSGLSAGSIHAHYRDKADLVRAAAREVLAERADALGEYGAADAPPGPDELLARLIVAIDPAEARVGVRTWGETTTDPAVRDIVVDMTYRMRAMLHDCVAAWLVEVEHHGPPRDREHATPIAHRVMALYQAQLLHTAMRTPKEETAS
ncbi:hypothetical protein JS756_00865 [Streptomyces actuosus]|uniref:TetR family transcriptional regulator n=1 Tax=Streptomyces actuosus TaxID=1885 RepID=A0ABS2VHX3_STRAS|nr:hypothetical protein [Streptomyces actuosus]MBN0042685.1 hypothetical protein [Streptomyces actuosus]